MISDGDSQHSILVESVRIAFRSGDSVQDHVSPGLGSALRSACTQPKERS